ncbi:class A beta-lactamase-related serine hydrolase [bacterium]|nr:MAG: class A beta-lactamase-related serine hydrolase [bacterium]
MPRRYASPRLSSVLRAGLIAGALCALFFAVLARSVVAAPAPSPGLDPAMSAEIDALAQREIDEGHAPGISLGVGRGDVLLYARGYGEADVAGHVRARPETAYAVGSLTKQFTAAAILLLAQDGALSIDDALSQYVPEFNGSAEITLRELLQQRSGVPDYTRVPGLDPTQTIDWRAFIGEVNRLPAEFAPGSAYRYNNLNYLLLGKVVERVSGGPLEAFVARRIARPLHLTSTGMLPERQPQAVGYTRLGGAAVPARRWDPSLLGGAGGLVSSAVDLVRWDAALFGGRVLSPSSLAILTTPGGEEDYAMGWVSELRGREHLLWHNGELGGFQAMNAVLPKRGLFVVVLENTDGLNAPALQPDVLARRIIAVLEPGSAFGEGAAVQERALPADPALAARVAMWVRQFETARIDRSGVTPGMDAALTPAVERETAAAWAPLGTLSKIEILGHEQRDALDVYVLRLEFARGPFVWKIAVTRDGKLAGAGSLEPAR